MEQKKHIDFGDPNTAVIIGLAFVSDALILFIPLHYAMALYAGAMLFQSLRGFMAKTLFLVGAILPLPFFGILMIVSIALSNSKLLRVVGQQVAIQIIAAASGGLGEVLEVGVVGSEGAEAAGATIEAAKAGKTAVQTTRAVSRETTGALSKSERFKAKAKDKILEHIKDRIEREDLDDDQQDAYNISDDEWQKYIDTYFDEDFIETA